MNKQTAVIAGAPTTRDSIAQVRDLYDRGLYLQALRRGEELLGPIARWPGVDGRLIAGRLAHNMGGRRLGDVLHRLARRADPTHGEAAFYHAFLQYSSRDSYDFLGWLRNFEIPGNSTTDIVASFHCMRAVSLARLRDAEAAAREIELAKQVAPSSAWVWVELAETLHLADQRDEALAAARRALDIRPWYRPAIQKCAGLLAELGDDAAAVALLRSAQAHSESAALHIELSAILVELREYTEAQRELDRAEALSPLADKRFKAWLCGVRARTAMLAGDRARAIEFCRGAGPGYYALMAERLADASRPDKRVLLPVAFVPQNYSTCAPASITTIARYFNQPVDHLAVAEEICYGGTPLPEQRDWAERAGWTVREFTVTWDDTVALLDRGVPFILSTVNSTIGHAQVMIGYDASRGVILIRDPSSRHVGEANAEAFFEQQAFHGPRGSAMLPPEETHRIAGLNLTDVDIYDRLHELQRALRAFDRACAGEIADRIAREHPAHRLALDAAAALAAYDCDDVARLQVRNEMLACYPDVPWLLLDKCCLLDTLGTRADRLALLEPIAKQPLADPMLLQALAGELLSEAPRHEEAERLLRRAIRWMPNSAGVFYTLGSLFWRKLDFEKALEAYRFALCLEGHDESIAQVYFACARELGRGEEAIAFLRARSDRLGPRSSRPSRTLAIALETCGRTVEAFTALDEAVARHPTDGPLLLHAAELRQRYGQDNVANDLLRRAEELVSRAAWLRAAASLARSAGKSNEALGLFRQVLSLEPLAIDAHRATAQLLMARSGLRAAIDHLRAAADANPKNARLQMLLVEMLRDFDGEEHERVLRRLLAINPTHSWAQRELALALRHDHRHDEALSAARAAVDNNPTLPQNLETLGHCEASAGHREAARDAFERALRISIDHEGALFALLRLLPTADEKIAALRFALDELHRQVIYGAGVLAFQRAAAELLPEGELRRELDKLREARPDLWQCWSACVRERLHDEEYEAAAQIVQDARRRFPMNLEVLSDAASVFEALEQRDEALAALREMLAIAPDHEDAVLRLAHLMRTQDEPDAAASVLERAIAVDPLNAVLLATLAELCWSREQREPAVTHMRRALELEPGLVRGWDDYRDWCGALGHAEAADELARHIAAERPLEARSWLIVARTLRGPQTLEERLAALHRASDLEPTLVEPHDLRACYLAEAGRHDDALAACNPPELQPQPPQLTARGAWVLAERGDMRAAIAQMQDALAADPTNSNCWRMLMPWIRRVGTRDELLRAATAWINALPHDAGAYGWRGVARWRAENLIGAMQDYRHALHILPSYEGAARDLFNCALLARDVETARFASERLAGMETDSSVEWREIRIANIAGDAAAIATGFRTLCTDAEADAAELLTATDFLREHRHAQLAEKVLTETVAQATFSYAAAAAWGKRIAPSLPVDATMKSLDAMRKRCDAGWLATSTYLVALPDTRKFAGWPWPVWRRRAELRSDRRTWGALAMAYCKVGRYDRALAWTTDWQARTDASSADLIGVALARWARGTLDEARRISQTACEQPHDGSSDPHRLLLSLALAINGNFAEAIRQRGLVREAIGADFYVTLELMRDALQTAAPTSERSARQRSAAAHEIMRKVWDRLGKFRLTNAVHRSALLYVTRAIWKHTRTWESWFQWMRAIRRP